MKKLIILLVVVVVLTVCTAPCFGVTEEECINILETIVLKGE